MLGGAMLSPESTVPGIVVFTNRVLGIGLMAVVVLMIYSAALLNTDINAEREKAEKASAAKSRFLGYISHDLRTPLNAIIARMDVIRAGVSEGRVLRDLEYVEGHAGLLNAFIHELLDYARNETQRNEIQPVPILETIKEVTALFQPLVPEGVTLETAIDPNLEFPTDPRVLQHILLNLISNALKFTKFGSVTVYAGSRPSGLHISVEDTGTGVSESLLRQMFEPGITTDGDGLGLGLALTRHFVASLGGTISATSEGPESGLTVDIHLPRIHGAFASVTVTERTGMARAPANP